MVSAVREEETLYECRHCGVSIEDDVTTCPTCGSTEVAQYELE
ncbi:hypothetical protein C500_00137 [Natrialba magadii ATCC 43099]|uniref:Zinc-ribbon domain-containing protein n=1 Tax=Natrialba magadii (strain ATCC 43099 / DSM 3394 / CCM 3739 / CIP 104546 / IAM 13178 / JCM 8861 / NBRC 102185 / NCIMB 2190 / MS3) TaxID=547559 RepID=L9VBS0_NATMM|nr:hypothetical protein C500_00137 [Natrialba magadii ATCC 43099]